MLAEASTADELFRRKSFDSSGLVNKGRNGPNHIPLGGDPLAIESHQFHERPKMKLSIHRILFPTDFSPASQNARNHACAIAGLLDAELHVLHVVNYPHLESSTSGSWFIPEQTRVPEAIHDAEERIASQMRNSLILDSHIIKAIRLGEPGREILKYAAENEIQLIVIGTHGRTGISRALIGSIAERVVQQATCPVLSVHSESFQVQPEKAKVEKHLATA